MWLLMIRIFDILIKFFYINKNKICIDVDIMKDYRNCRDHGATSDQVDVILIWFYD